MGNGDKRRGLEGENGQNTKSKVKGPGRREELDRRRGRVGKKLRI